MGVEVPFPSDRYWNTTREFAVALGILLLHDLRVHCIFPLGFRIPKSLIDRLALPSIIHRTTHEMWPRHSYISKAYFLHNPLLLKLPFRATVHSLKYIESFSVKCPHNLIKGMASEHAPSHLPSQVPTLDPWRPKLELVQTSGLNRWSCLHFKSLLDDALTRVLSARLGIRRAHHTHFPKYVRYLLLLQ